MHNIPIRIILNDIINDSKVTDQIHIKEILHNKDQRKSWFKDIRFNEYNKIILFPREATKYYFNFERLFEFCTFHNIEVINGDCVETLDKFSLNQLWKENGINVPDMYLLQHELDRFDVPDTDYPMIISANVGHGGFGKHTIVYDGDSIEMWMRYHMRSINKIVTKFIPYRNNDGYFRKGRVIRLKDDYIDVNVMGHRTNWYIHHTTDNVQLLCPDCSYYRNTIIDFDDQIKKLFEISNIEVGAIDFCAIDNVVIPFEITVPYNRSYRNYEWNNENYNKFKNESINNICQYYITYLRDLCDVKYDWTQFETDFIKYVYEHKGIMNG